jgi:dihydrofolate reductase
MANTIWHITMSLDGFIAGPNDSMDWAVREWSDGGTNTRDIEVERSPVADDILRSAGAILGGRRWYDIAQRLYDGVHGIYGGEWSGPVFVLTHRPPDAAADPSVTFVSSPLPDAVGTVRTAADGKNVVIFGANLAKQCLQEGLLDEIVIHPRAGPSRRRCPTLRVDRHIRSRGSAPSSRPRVKSRISAFASEVASPARARHGCLNRKLTLRRPVAGPSRPPPNARSSTCCAAATHPHTRQCMRRSRA